MKKVFYLFIMWLWLLRVVIDMDIVIGLFTYLLWGFIICYRHGGSVKCKFIVYDDYLWVIFKILFIYIFYYLILLKSLFIGYHINLIW